MPPSCQEEKCPLRGKTQQAPVEELPARMSMAAMIKSQRPLLTVDNCGSGLLITRRPRRYPQNPVAGLKGLAPRNREDSISSMTDPVR